MKSLKLISTKRLKNIFNYQKFIIISKSYFFKFIEKTKIKFNSYKTRPCKNFY